ncbi:MAG: gamma-glutamyl-gamma-aminobutyrate hydrolase family protein [Methylophaga sp.]|nr:gamma-glutamyl-gamma-aminobutyrate hydrolase family protein [Methylophaga sp.]
MPASIIRIGLTMRLTQAEGYNEPRDALAQDWHQFLKTALPDASWLAIPNLGAEQVIDYCKQWGINRLILTGGGDLGVSDIREETEIALLKWAELNDIPTIGICRGMQVMSVWAGEELMMIENHVGSRHHLKGEMTGEVNSYHNYAVKECPNKFKILARSEEGYIEAICHEKKPLMGWMWHPERENPIQLTDTERLRRFFL